MMPARSHGADTMRTVNGRHEFNAPAEVVFGVLTDPDRTTRWLPLGMSTVSAATDHVEVRADGRIFRYGVSSVPEQLRVEWSSREADGLRGAAWVRDAPAGGCVVHAEVTFPGGAAEGERVQELLAEAMRHLQRDVSDNFNPG
jgi:Polyketide cyclase / dehydrase and lipid transport